MSKLKGFAQAGACALGIVFSGVGATVLADSEDAGRSEKIGGGLFLAWIAASTARWGRSSYQSFTAPSRDTAAPSSKP